MREDFEKLGNIKPVISACFFDDLIDEYTSLRLPEYSLGFVNGALYAYQEQQKKIDLIIDCVRDNTADYELDNKIKEILK